MNSDLLLTEHLATSRYGSFALTDAVRPGPTLPVLPREGYRVRIYRDRAAALRLPMLSASVSAEKLFDCFLDLLKPLGELVHVVVETSHNRDADDHLDFRRTHIDRSVFASHCCEFEDLLLNDGCTGVAVLSTRGPLEVQFDEHKLLHVYAPDLKRFRRVLRRYEVRRTPDLQLITDGEHLHHTTDDYEDTFKQFCTRVGVAEFDRVLSDE